MKKNNTEIEKYRVTKEVCLNSYISKSFVSDKSYGNNGLFMIKKNNVWIRCIVSDLENWDHVSVSIEPSRLTNWEEMKFVKELFWGDEETVLQFHPKKTAYVNVNKYVLHLWKPQSIEIVLPDLELV